MNNRTALCVLFCLLFASCASLTAIVVGTGAGALTYAGAVGPLGIAFAVLLATFTAAFVSTSWIDIYYWWTHLSLVSLTHHGDDGGHDPSRGPDDPPTFSWWALIFDHWILAALALVFVIAYLTQEGFRALVNQIAKHVWAVICTFGAWFLASVPTWIEKWSDRKPDPIVKIQSPIVPVQPDTTPDAPQATATPTG